MVNYPYRPICAWMALPFRLVTYCALLRCCILLALLFTCISLIACIPVLLIFFRLPMCICSSFIPFTLLSLLLFLLLISLLLLFCSCARASLLCRFSQTARDSLLQCTLDMNRMVFGRRKPEKQKNGFLQKQCSKVCI